MSEIVASAPGKVVVAGEYAVLDGAPAICMAVDRRARVTVSAGANAGYTVTAPGFLSDTLHLVSPAESADEIPLLKAVWQQMPSIPDEPLNIELDSRDMQQGGDKLGIGSSAAVAVALAAALQRTIDGGAPVADIALVAHRELQGGAGSGVDIACSFTGGVIEYRMAESRTDAAAWPTGLHYTLLWSGQSASTAAQLEKLEQAGAHASREELCAAATTVAAVWRGQSTSQIVEVMSEYTNVLRRFDADHSLGIFGAGHASLADIATANGIVYKPCGAGGGDLGIALSDDPAALSAFVDAARQGNFAPLDLRLDEQGVAVEGTLQ